MNAPLALVTGAGGLVGSHLVAAAADVPGWTVRGLTRAELDLTDATSLRETLAELAPRVVVHCAAMTGAEQCARDPGAAHRINVEATRILADACADRTLVLLSSNHVFDGRRGAYAEADPPCPLGVYGETKAAAEAAVLDNPAHLVVRTCLNGGVSPTGDRSFSEGLRRAWAAGRTTVLFADEHRSPIPAAVTARAVWALVAGGARGLYHVAGAQRLSRLEIGRRLATRWPGVAARIEPGSLADHAGQPRPPDLSLACDKAQALLPFALPRFSAWLADNPGAPL